MGRQYMHQPVDVDTAQQVGLRKSRHPATITFHALRAADEGTIFLVGNDRVWSATTVPAEYLAVQG